MRKKICMAIAAVAALVAASARATELGWTAGPMASDGSTIRTDGTLVYAYSARGGTVGGVTFTAAADFANAAMVSASPAPTGSVKSEFQTDGASGAFGAMLESGWYWGYNGAAAGELSFTLTLKGLTAGRTYLLQLVSHRQSNSTLVSANGSTPVNIHGNDEAHYKYGASIVGIFEATGATADFTVTYSAASSGMRPLNAIQVRDLGASGGGGGGDPVETPVYTLTIPAKTGLVLDSVTTNGVAVAVANNACSIVSNTTVTINFTAASGYEITSGNPVVLTVTGDKTLAEGEYPVAQEQGGGGGEDPVVPVADGWTAVAMGPTSASIRTDGTLKYAYARGDYTVNGVTFVGVGSGIISNANCVVWEATGGSQTVDPTTPSDTETGGYKALLGHTWWATAKGRKIKLNNLEAGKQYLVQIIAFRHDFTTQTATAPDGEHTIRFGGTGWEYGGSLIGIFTASGTSAEFSILYVGQACINGIQVRELGANPPARKGVLISVY